MDRNSLVILCFIIILFIYSAQTLSTLNNMETKLVSFRKKKQFYINLQKSKTNLRKSNVKRFKVFNSSMPLKFQAPVSLIVNLPADGEVKEIFKNVLYRNKSAVSMDLSNDSEESEYELSRSLSHDISQKAYRSQITHVI